jgi:hypothetical protein
VSAGGTEDPEKGWDWNRSTNVWREPLTGVVMLAPLPTTSAWATMTYGNYTRLSKASYALTTPAKWVENHRGLDGNIYLESLGVNEIVTTAESWPADQPFFLSIYVPGVPKLAEQAILECGWGSPGTGIWLRIRANGQVAVYKDSEQISVGTLAYAARQKSINLSTVNLMLLPIRPRRAGADADEGRLVIATDQGGGHVVRFDGLIASGLPIVPAGAFWWRVPVGKASVQLAPLRFATTGTLWGPLRPLRYAPDFGMAWSGRAFQGRCGPQSGGPLAQYNLYRSDRATVFSATGALNEVVPCVTLSSIAGTATPCIEAFDAEFGATFTTTHNGPIDIARVAQSVSFAVDEEGVGTLSATATRGDLETLGVDRPHLIGDRPFALSLLFGGNTRIVVMRGTLEKPVWTPGDGAANGAGDLIELRGTDRTAAFEACRLVEGLPFDDERLADIVPYLVTRAGFPSASVTVSATPLRVAASPGLALGTWASVPQRGDSVKELLDKLKADYCANWWTGWAPSGVSNDAGGGVIYRWDSPMDLPVVPAITLYESRADALAAGVPAAEVPERVIRGIKRHPTLAEANQVIVVGQRESDQRLLFGEINDAASQAAAAAPAARPENWMGGFVRRVIDVDPLIQSQDNADYGAGVLASRLMQDRHIADISCSLLLQPNSAPVWRSQVFRIVLRGRQKWEDFRILEILRALSPRGYTADEIAAGRRERWECEYRGERIAQGNL